MSPSLTPDYELAGSDGWKRQTCDQCGAKPGEPCRTGSERNRGRPHEARIRDGAARVDVRSVKCPACLVEPGQECQTWSGRRTGHHAPRRKKALTALTGEFT